MEKKYRLTDKSIMVSGNKLYRIEALRDFSDERAVKAGDLGGYIQSEKNLSHEGNCWVYDYACVYDNAAIYGDATVSNYSCIHDNAEIYDNAVVRGYARIWDHARVYDGSRVCGNAEVFGYAKISNFAEIYDSVCVYGNAHVHGSAKIYNNTRIFNGAEVYGNAKLYDHSIVCNNATICGNAIIYNNAAICSNALVTTSSDYSVISQFGTRVTNTTTFFRCKDGLVRVSCGCFTGTLEEFRKQVNKTRTGIICMEYLMIADLMELHFNGHISNR